MLLLWLISLGPIIKTRLWYGTPISLFDCQPRTDVRVRVRRIVVRVQVRHTAISVRVVVRPIDHTTYKRKYAFI